jgi:hypothetical protein
LNSAGKREEEQRQRERVQQRQQSKVLGDEEISNGSNFLVLRFYEFMVIFRTIGFKLFLKNTLN